MIAVYYLDELEPDIPDHAKGDDPIWHTTETFERDYEQASKMCVSLGKSLREDKEFMEALEKSEKWFFDTCASFQKVSSVPHRPFHSRPLYQVVQGDSQPAA
jgi:hypothetical protein